MPTASSSNSEYVVDYKAKNGKPYLAEYLDSAWMYRDPVYKEQMNTVDEWINFEITRLNLKPTKETYGGIFFDLVKKLGVHKYADASEKIKKVSTLLRDALEKQRYYSKLGLDLKALDELF